MSDDESNEKKGLSEYELKRLERIKENKKLLAELFPDGITKLEEEPLLTNYKEETPISGRGVKRSRSHRKLRYSIKRNPRRQSANYVSDYYDGPLTRSMRTRLDSTNGELVDGLEDEQEVRRIVYAPRKRRCIVEDNLPIELDGLPGADSKYLKRVSNSTKDKVYDRINGTTCHQCRQKTIDQKTICHNKNCNGVRGQFCGPCLRNRYGEEIREALLDKLWVCPPCRGKCNCSFCLPKKGCPPTGIMIHIAKEAGYDSVQEYLEKLVSSCLALK